jgi:hypothetical protein
VQAIRPTSIPQGEASCSAEQTPVASSSSFDSHLLQERTPPRLAVERTGSRAPLHFGETAIALNVGSIEPLKRGVHFSSRAWVATGPMVPDATTSA